MILHDLRAKKGYSQSRLASVSGVKLNTIQSYEGNKKDLNKAHFDTLAALSIALDCKISDLITDEKLKSKALKLENR